MRTRINPAPAQKVTQHPQGAGFTPARVGHRYLEIVLIKFWIIGACLFALIFVGCATMRPSTSFNPGSINNVRFRDRAQSKQDDDLRVTVAVPSNEESKALFGADLSIKEIQPIWVKVENHSDQTYYLLSVAIDPNYFSPMEAAYTIHGGLSQSAQNEVENYFRSMNFRNPILPNTSVSGFIFTNFDEGEKLVQVDLIANQQTKFFTFFVQIPGMRVDYRMVDFDKLYSDEEIVEFDRDELRTALTGDPYFTDGLRALLILDPGPISLNQVIDLGWERPKTFHISD